MQTENQPYILSIDLGTSGPKAGLYTLLGDPVGYAFEKTQLFLFPGGGAEQDPHEWWQAICTTVQRLLTEHPEARQAVTAINVTTQWSGTVPIDREGNPLMNAIIWMDSRGAPYARHITGGPVRLSGYGVGKLLTWLRLTGGVPGHAGKDPIAHILYLQAERPEIYRQTYKFLEPKDYINSRLTGVFAASYDSIALHWLTDNRDLSKVDYDERLLSFSNIERDKLPDLLPPNSLLGTISPQAAAELGLPRNAQVISGTPDVQSAAVGSGAVEDFSAHLYIGTSAWLACHVPFKKTDILHNIASLPAAIPGRFLVTDEQEIAGGCLNYLRDKLFFPDDEFGQQAPQDTFQRFDEMAARIPAGSENLIFTPWLYGERTPVDDELIRGGFFNQSLRHTRGHLVRAVFEGVAYNARWLLGFVEKFAKRRLDPIYIVGGGAQSDIWCQIHADIFNRTILQVQDPLHVNAHGAALLASLALGALRVDEIRQRVPIERTYQPDPANRGIYERLFKEFVNLYDLHRPLHARLNRA